MHDTNGCVPGFIGSDKFTKRYVYFPEPNVSDRAIHHFTIAFHGRPAENAGYEPDFC